MTTSRIFMEPSRKTMSGKGREGKGREGRTRVAGFTTSSSYVPAPHRDDVVSASRPDEHTDLTSIEHLDFDITCKSARCVDAPPRADYIVVAASLWTAERWPRPWECCNRCYSMSNEVAAKNSLPPAWRILEVLR